MTMKIVIGILLVLFIGLLVFGGWFARPKDNVSPYGKYASAYCEKYEITSPGCLK